MTLITPVGKKDFEWSPIDKSMVKTAASGKTAKTDKDLLYEAAKKVVAQFNLDVEESEIADGASPDGVGETGGLDMPPAIVDGSPSAEVPTNGEIPPVEETATEAPTGEAGEAGGTGTDVQKAVKELVDKADKAEETAAKVQEAVGKVEEAVQEVKDAAGIAAEEVGVEGGEGGADEVVMEVEVEGEEGEEGEEKGDKGKDNKNDKGEKKEKKDKGDKEDKKDEIIQESCEASAKAVEMKSAASDPDDLTKISKISPTTRRKVYIFYKDYLDYDPAYCKLMVTDFEK